MKIDAVEKQETAVKLTDSQARALRRALHAVYGAGKNNPAEVRAQLDGLALPHMKHAAEVNFPQDDFLMLRGALKAREEQARRENAQNELREEEDLIVRGAACALSARVLDIYLRRALKRYRTLAERTQLLDARETDARVNALRVRGVRACLGTLCARRAWGLCLGVMRHYKAVLGEEIFRSYALLIRTGFAQDKAAQAWQQTDENIPAQLRREQALKALAPEPDNALKTIAREQVEVLFARHEQALARTRAEVYAQLAEGKTTDVSVLAREEISRALRAFEQRTCDVISAQAHVFNTLFFEGTPDSIYNAFCGGKISARDYLLSMGAYYGRESGQDNLEAQLLAEGMMLFCTKNNLPQACAQEAVYEILRTEPERRPARAQSIKKIYLLQEQTK